jgi:hypothetical protein
VTLLLLALACGGAPADDAEGDGESTAVWEGGELDFVTRAVDDECLGGALEALFMPEGPNTPHPFLYPVYAPPYDALPSSYDVDFREPFIGMPVTVTEGDDGVLEIRGSVMDEVTMGFTWGDCVTTMAVDADLFPTGATTLVGEARISISDPRGEQERCPVFDQDPCTVTLDLAASGR